MSAQEWVNLGTPSDTTVLHKMCSVNDKFWAVDYGYGKIYHSEDKGKNWNLQYQTDGKFLEEIQFVDENTGFLCGDFGIVMKTIDGGETWKEIGPTYEPRVTRTNSLEGDSTALMRYFYQMYFKDANNGLLWGFELKPSKGWSSSKRFFYQTLDSGKEWRRIEFQHPERDSIVNAFIGEQKIIEDVAMGVYHREDKSYAMKWYGLEISNAEESDSKLYPLAQLPKENGMLRTVNFISDSQGYIFGGNHVQEEISEGYILETLDGGQSWRHLETDMPHIHDSTQKGQDLWLSAKEGVIRKWTPIVKKDSSFIQTGNASRILIDGQIQRNEWKGANKTIIREGVDLFTIQDDHFVYLSIQYDTTEYQNYYCDLYIDLGTDTLLNIHASQQLGERKLAGTDWTDSEPPFAWGYVDQWTANQIKFDRSKKQFIPYSAMEFQISKSRLPKDKLKIAFQSRDINWEQDIVNWPENSDFKSTIDWKVFYYE